MTNMEELEKINKEINELERRKEFLYKKKIFEEHKRRVGDIEEQKGGWTFFSSEGFSPMKHPHCWYVITPMNEKEFMKKGYSTSAIPFDTEEEAIAYSKKIKLRLRDKK